MSRKLAGENIPYTLVKQVDYDGATAGTWFDPAEVTAMRCDGLVEYVYEWYGYRVHGSVIVGVDHWDVTRVGYWEREVHELRAVTPKSQATEDLHLVTSSLP
jgi:hypothetical protein